MGKDYKEMDQFYDGAGGISEAKNVLENDDVFKPEFNDDGGDDIIAKCALTLDSLTTFDVYIAPKNEGDVLTVWSAYGTLSCQVTQMNDGRHLVRVKGIEPYNFDKEIAILGSVNGEGCELRGRPLVYPRYMGQRLHAVPLGMFHM